MTDNNELAARPKYVPESLRTLAEYLERALDSATSIVMMRPTDGVCIVYLGDPAGLREDLKQIATIATSLANSMLESTVSGVNELQINDQIYRFARSFTQIDEMAAVVFSMA
ncbi:hypothetical protein PQQ53_03020 [Paraburkholderia strydomiana]|jgi:hypothetical protein|uniref:Roadblock/LAMTOR2 domain-containing protein n=1 Tax=Paraburkholderia strydomiana TaxID=1245417 RepID=A0ABW9EC48_9BURK